MFDMVSQHVESGYRVPNDRLLDKSISYLDGQRHQQDKHYPDPIDYLKKVMDERNLRNKDLMGCIGSSGNVCSVLKKRKPLSLRMIRNLNRYLDIPAEILIQPYNCR